MSLTAVVNELLLEIKKENIDPAEELGDELFIVVASLTPIVKDGDILLSWRDDEQCGAGWHLPGGCVRLKRNLRTKPPCLC